MISPLQSGSREYIIVLGHRNRRLLIWIYVPLMLQGFQRLCNDDDSQIIKFDEETFRNFFVGGGAFDILLKYIYYI